MEAVPLLLEQFLRTECSPGARMSLAEGIEGLACKRKEHMREWQFTHFTLTVDLLQGTATLNDVRVLSPEGKLVLALETFLDTLEAHGAQPGIRPSNGFPFTRAVVAENALKGQHHVPELGLADVLYGRTTELVGRPIATHYLAIAILFALACIAGGAFCILSSSVPKYTFDLGYYRRSTASIGVSFLLLGLAVAWRILAVMRKAGSRRE